MSKLIGQLLLALLAFMAVLALIKILHPYLVLVAVVLWVVAISAFLYANGRAPLLAGNQTIAKGLDWLLAVQLADDEELVVAPSQRNPQAALKEALYYLEHGVYGQNRVKGQINDIFSKLEASPHTGLRALTASEGAVILAKGPHGTGKTVIISQFISLLYGEQVLASENMIESDRLDFPSHSEPLDVLYGLIERGECGTIILHDADWLTEAEPGADALQGHGVGAAIQRIAKTDPHELLVIIELSDQATNRMLNDPEHRKWLDKLGLFEFDFQHLDDGSLTKILVDLFEGEGFSIAPQGMPKLQQLIQDIKLEDGDNFKNAHAMRQLAESVVRRFAQEDREDRVIGEEFLRAFIAER